MKIKRLLTLLRFWPPYLGAGVRVKSASDDFRSLEVEMPLYPWNKNYVGTHFGGSLYSMVDPFYMLMLMKNLGPEYIVWDKSASIHFRRPGKGPVHAIFTLTEEQIASIKSSADQELKVEPVFKVQIKDAAGILIAEVDKVLYVRRKDRLPFP